MPSEPTIDLSAWSPRSFRSLLETTPTTFSKSPANLTAPFLSDHRPHDDFHTKATKNLNKNLHTQQIYFLKCICLLAIPRPVRSNPLSLLFLTATAQIRTKGGDERGSRLAMLEVRYPLLQDNGTFNGLTSGDATAFISRKKLEASCREYFKGPKSPMSLEMNVAQKEKYIFGSPSLLSLYEAQSQDSHSHITPASPWCFDQAVEQDTQLIHEPELLNTSDLSDSMLDPYPSETHSQNERNSSVEPTQTYSEKDSPSSLTMLETLAPQDSLMVQKEKAKKKGKGIATRRSQRIRERERTNDVAPKPSKVPKGKAIDLSFQLKSKEIPLQANDATKILQASGLQINQKVQDMIQEALNLDLANTATDDSSPCTPLHDHIPPLLMPEDSMVL